MIEKGSYVVTKQATPSYWVYRVVDLNEEKIFCNPVHYGDMGKPFEFNLQEFRPATESEIAYAVARRLE